MQPNFHTLHKRGQCSPKHESFSTFLISYDSIHIQISRKCFIFFICQTIQKCKLFWGTLGIHTCTNALLALNWLYNYITLLIPDSIIPHPAASGGTFACSPSPKPLSLRKDMVVIGNTKTPLSREIVQWLRPKEPQSRDNRNTCTCGPLMYLSGGGGGGHSISLPRKHIGRGEGKCDCIQTKETVLRLSQFHIIVQNIVITIECEPLPIYYTCVSASSMSRAPERSEETKLVFFFFFFIIIIFFFFGGGGGGRHCSWSTSKNFFFCSEWRHCLHLSICMCMVMLSTDSKLIPVYRFGFTCN